MPRNPSDVADLHREEAGHADQEQGVELETTSPRVAKARPATSSRGRGGAQGDQHPDQQAGHEQALERQCAAGPSAPERSMTR